MKNGNYKHFLTYDQLCFDGIKYGLTDLFYRVSGNCLYIERHDHRQGSVQEMEFETGGGQTDLEILDHWLIELFSQRYSFDGKPVLVKSDLFSTEQFTELMETGLTLRKQRMEQAQKAAASNPLIALCKEKGLYPDPTGIKPHIWEANCPFGRGHRMMLSIDTDTWGCGYCRKKGGLEELREFTQL